MLFKQFVKYMRSRGVMICNDYALIDAWRPICWKQIKPLVNLAGGKYSHSTMMAYKLKLDYRNRPIVDQIAWTRINAQYSAQHIDAHPDDSWCFRSMVTALARRTSIPKHAIAVADGGQHCILMKHHDRGLESGGAQVRGDSTDAIDTAINELMATYTFITRVMNGPVAKESRELEQKRRDLQRQANELSTKVWGMRNSEGFWRNALSMQRELMADVK